MSSEIWYRIVSDSFACSLFQRQYFRFLFYFTATGAKYRVAAVKCLPVLHHSADFISVGMIELILVTLKIEYRLSRWWGRDGLEGGGHIQPGKLHCCIWRTLTNPNLWFSFFCIFFVSKDSLLDFYLMKYASRAFTRISNAVDLQVCYTTTAWYLIGTQRIFTLLLWIP